MKLKQQQPGEKEDGLGDFTANTHRCREGALSPWRKEWREGREGVMGRKVQRKHGSGHRKQIFQSPALRKEGREEGGEKRHLHVDMEAARSALGEAGEPQGAPPKGRFICVLPGEKTRGLTLDKGPD